MTVLFVFWHFYPRWHSNQWEDGPHMDNYFNNINTQHSKRHSEGTFSSDFTRFLDKIKAKNFVEWLTSKKGGG